MTGSDRPHALVWSAERHGTGIEWLDAQHRELFRRVAVLREALAAGKARDGVLGALDYLAFYVREHFDCEEREVLVRRCRTCPLNEEQHRWFAAELARLRAACAQGEDPVTLGPRLERLLVGWLDTHIAEVDVGLRERVAD